MKENNTVGTKQERMRVVCEDEGEDKKVEADSGFEGTYVVSQT
jgi:hypothetical protein